METQQVIIKPDASGHERPHFDIGGGMDGHWAPNSPEQH